MVHNLADLIDQNISLGINDSDPMKPSTFAMRIRKKKGYNKGFDPRITLCKEYFLFFIYTFGGQKSEGILRQKFCYP